MATTARSIWPAGAAIVFLALLVGGAFAGLASQAIGDPSGIASAFDPYLLRVARFTLWQATLSTLLSVLPAIFVARALSRHPRFAGRALILKLFALPLGLPALVAALGVLALYGRAGIVGDAIAALGLGQWPGVYGLSGVLVAHAFFNLPLATRLLLEQLDAVPVDNWRVASQLGMKGSALFRLVEWPAMRAGLPGIAALVFMLCVTSFTLVLTLGGGPAATTLEVAIYQALRFDFDPGRAVTLTIVQLALTLSAVALLARLGGNAVGDANLAVSGSRFRPAGDHGNAIDLVVVGAALAFVAAPLVAVTVRGLDADLGRLIGEDAFLRAFATSLALGGLAATLAVALALALVGLRFTLEARRRDGPPGFAERAVEHLPPLILVVPPTVIGAGWFILTLGSGLTVAIAPPMIVAVNAAMAMPFAIRAIRPAHDAGRIKHDRLCAQLGIGGWNRWRLVDWPWLRRALAIAFAFAFALSLGDLGVVALFGSDAVETLPYLLYQRLGSYRTADAAGLALILGVLCLAIIAAADRLGSGKAGL